MSFPNLGCDGGNLQNLRPADNILAPKLAASYQLMPRGWQAELARKVEPNFERQPSNESK